MSQNNQRQPRKGPSLPPTADDWRALPNPPNIPPKDFNYAAVDWRTQPLPPTVHDVAISPDASL